MSRRPLAPLLVVAVLLSGCGDPIVVLGDKPGTLRRVAGIPDAPGPGSASDALATALNLPSGVAAAADGTLYVADQRNGRVLVVGTDGSLQVLADAASCGPGACLDRPVEVALDALGDVLVADRGADRVFLVDAESGAVSVVAGSSAAQEAAEGAVAVEVGIGDPQGVAALADGSVLFSDAGGQRVWRVAPDGTLRLVAGSGRPSYGGDGGPATAAHLRGPTALATDGARLYIADTGNHRVRVVDLATGVIQTVAGSGAAGFAGDGGSAAGALLSSPRGLALTPPGDRLYIADSGNHRVRVVDVRSGTIRTFAGTGSPIFTGELLDAGDTSLAEPLGVAVSARGFLYIADSGHHIVWRTPIGF